MILSAACGGSDPGDRTGSTGGTGSPEVPDNGPPALLRIVTAGEPGNADRILAEFHFWNTNAWGAAPPDRAADAIHVGGIRIRGSSSQMFPKKGFGIEIWKSATDRDDRSVALLGMPAESDWVLHGPYSDKSLLRNYLAYLHGRLLGRYAPRTRFVEVRMDVPDDGSDETVFAGLYLLVEKIKRGPSRVPIRKLAPEHLAEPEITGGYILKVDKWSAGETGFTTARGTTLIFDYPKAERLTAAQFDWAKAYLEAFEAALDDEASREAGAFLEYIDLDTFVDFFIVNELSANVDGYRISSWLYKDRGGRLCAGPLWDFNLAFGNADYYEAWLTAGWQIERMPYGYDMEPPFWWRRLLAHPAFRSRLKQRWTGIRAADFSDEALAGQVDAAVARIGAAAARNFQVWPVLGHYIWPNAVVYDSWPEEITYLKTWLLARAAWIDGTLAGW